MCLEGLLQLRKKSEDGNKRRQCTGSKRWKWQSKVTDETDPGEEEEGPIKASE